MVHNIKVAEKPSQLPLIHCLHPSVIHLDHDSRSAVIGLEPLLFMYYYLFEDETFNHFIEDTEDCYWAVVLGF